MFPRNMFELNFIFSWEGSLAKEDVIKSGQERHKF